MSARSSPAALRNRGVIADVLADILPAGGLVLMIAEGSGEHAVHFAERFPALDWQPTDPDPEALASIAHYRAAATLPNLRPPLRLDASAAGWPVRKADAVLCINMVHISPWSATEGLMRGAAAVLPSGGSLFLYGPYLQSDVETAASNLAFDESLRARNPAWGLRRLDDVTALAKRNGLTLEKVTAMPANNLSLAFRRGGN